MGEKNLVVEIECPFCGAEHLVIVNDEAFEKWQNGALIQNVMPDLLPTEREQLVSGLCLQCQKEMFG